MTTLNGWRLICVIPMLCIAMAIAAHGQTLTTLVNFIGTNGAAPLGAPVQGLDGGFYSTTAQDGPPTDGGTIFEVTPSDMLKTLYGFDGTDGTDASGPLVLALDGSLYGVAMRGGSSNCTLGCGTIFELSASDVLTTLHAFCSEATGTSPACVDGEGPNPGLILGVDGDFYGTTRQGGAYGAGEVFKMTPRGRLTILHSFAAEQGDPDGELPSAGLVQATDGNFYGTTEWGAKGGGTVFRVTPNGGFSTIYSFCAAGPACVDGEMPLAPLVEGVDGNLYGTTWAGGTSSSCQPFSAGCGTVFKVTKSGDLTTLHSFSYSDGAYPQIGVIQGTDGNFYGGAGQGGEFSCDSFGCGTLFEITPSGTFTTLHNFDGNDGQEPSGLTQSTGGIFIGSTETNGVLAGTVFSLSTGLEPFVTFVKNYGKAGQTGGILGQGFTGTISVSFNGVPAQFEVRADTFLTATVPPGATTGYVTVTTPTGVLTSNVPFHVIQ